MNTITSINEKSESVNSDANNWEDYHQSGYFNTNYPFEDILRFVFRYSKKVASSEVKVLELGCGTGNNLGFVSENGLKGFGIDISQTAIQKAAKKYKDTSLEFQVGSFADLPYEDNSFDLIFDRKSLTCTPKTTVRESVKEAFRVLKPGGYFLFTPLSDNDSRFVSGPSKNGFVESSNNKRIQETVPFRGYSFWAYAELKELLEQYGSLQEVRQIQQTEMHRTDRLILSSWEIVCQKS